MIRVALVVPAGFHLSRDFPGIGLDEDLTSVLVTELAVPLEVSLPPFSPQALAERGITLHRSGTVEVSGRRATLVHASQKVTGVDFRKWMLVLGDENRVKLSEAALTSATGFLRSEVAAVLKTRTVPRLVFRFDESVEKTQRMQGLLDELRQEREGREENERQQAADDAGPDGDDSGDLPAGSD